MNKLTLKLRSGVSVACLLGLAATVSGQGALAGDWAGFYVGVNAGMASATVDFSSDSEGSGAGMVLGGYVDFNVVSGTTIYGVEADFGLSTLRINGGYEDLTIESMASIRGRLGMTFDDMHVYATGGYGMLGMTAGSSDGPAPANLAAPVIGVGIEMFLKNSASVRVEALQYLTNGDGVSGFDDNVDFRSNVTIFRIGYTLHL